ncbi:LADA_0A03598g1_1 [Lachancea dasiensis]|uniref:LADA_0A03598g1_1 n=1 Tax=Lachancea dasiensis TaxID=1072105 RepID=A0A1G4IN60_9SACH|nr:LADA_0A03598g1_1 [Lachancea dasiensis]
MEVKNLHRKMDTGDLEGSTRRNSHRGSTLKAKATDTLSVSGTSSAGNSLTASVPSDSSKDTKSSPSWTSSISTITEELPAPEVPESMTRVSSSSSVASMQNRSAPVGASSSSSPPQLKRGNSDVVRSWNVLPKIGETLHQHKYSMNVAVHSVNGTPRRIVYDPRYNPICPKLEIFYMFNAQSPPVDSYVHAKSRLQSFVKFLEVYHNSRRFAAACMPFNVSVSANALASGYPSFTSGVNYQEIGEVIQLWHLQALKFLLDKKSFLYSRDIVEYLVDFAPKKYALLKNKPLSGDAASRTYEETVQRADILLLRCSFEEELGWQLALDEPNWNVIDLFIDFSLLRKPSFTTGYDDPNDTLKLRYENDENLFSSSSASSASSASSPGSNSNSPGAKVQEDVTSPAPNGSKSVSSPPQSMLQSSRPTKSSSIIVQDCVGRDLAELSPKMQQNQEIAESRRPSVSETPSQESLSEPQVKGKGKKEQTSMLGRGSSAFGLSSFFRRRNSHAGVEKNDSAASSRQSSPHEAAKVPLNIQNKYLEDYYASTLANYRKLVTPAHKLFSEKVTSKQDQHEKTPGVKETRSYQEDFRQVKLPFNDNALPVVMCPDIWFSVELRKWKGLLSEIFRCIRPGGYLETSTCNFATVNDCNDLEKSANEFSTSAEMKALKDAISLEAARTGIQVFPMRHLVPVLKKVGFVNIKHSVVSIKRGDLTNKMGMLFEFLAMHQYDYQLRANFLSSKTAPAGTDLASFPLRYINEHMDKADENAGVLRFVLISAQKPDVGTDTS